MADLPLPCLKVACLHNSLHQGEPVHTAVLADSGGNSTRWLRSWRRLLQAAVRGPQIRGLSGQSPAIVNTMRTVCAAMM